MLQVNMFQAKSDLSKLVKLLENKEEDVIYIARNGKEIAQLTLIPNVKKNKRIGIAEGIIHDPVDFDSNEWNKEIENLFFGGGNTE